MRAPNRDRPRNSVGPTALLAGRLHGIRSWNLHRDRTGSLRLTGYAYSTAWLREGKTTWARCRTARARSGTHERSPDPACDCGLYALHPWQEARRWGSPGALTVQGIVEAWGKVHVYEEGFRAQYARPRALALIAAPEDSEYGRLVAQLARTHCAELLVLDSPAGLRRHCRREGLGLSRGAVASLLDADGITP